MGHGGAFVRVAGGLIAGALAALAMGAFATNAQAKTTGFHVYNLTGHPQELYDLFTNTTFDTSSTAPRRPRVGDVLMPGADRDHNHFELVFNRRSICPSFKCDYTNFVSLDYRTVGNPKQTLNVLLSDGFDGFARYPFTYCTPTTRCKVQTDKVVMVDPPGTVNTVTGTDLEEQARVLRQLCTEKNDDASLVKCRFDWKDRRHTVGDPHLIGNSVLANCTDDDVEIDDEFSDKVGGETSYGQKFGTEIEQDWGIGKVKASIELEFKEKYLTEHEFKHSAKYVIKPGHLGYLVTSTPVIRDVGDFTLEIGNTKYNLPHVHFDTPDTTRQAAVASVFIPKTPEMTDTQKEDFCETDADPIDLPKKAPDRSVTLKQTGTRDAEAMFGGRESTIMIAKGGADIVRGSSGNDRLLGGPGRDLIEAGPGSDTIVDSRGRTQASTGAGGHDGPDFVDVRDGEGDDRVICGSSRASVQADPGDSVRHCGK